MANSWVLKNNYKPRFYIPFSSATQECRWSFFFLFFILYAVQEQPVREVIDPRRQKYSIPMFTTIGSKPIAMVKIYHSRNSVLVHNEISINIPKQFKIYFSAFFLNRLIIKFFSIDPLPPNIRINSLLKWNSTTFWLLL